MNSGLLVLLGGITLFVPAASACGIERAATLPLLSDVRPVVQVAIDGRFVQMIVDTGSQVSMVTPETVEALRLKRDPRHGSRIVTMGGVATSRNALLASLELAGLRYAGLSIAVSPLDGSKVDTGAAPAGLIGADLLHDFDLELDIPGRTLALYRPDACAPSRPDWQAPYVTLTATVTGRHQVMFPVALDGRPLRAMFDTGSRGETVSRDAANDLGVTEQVLLHDPATSGISGGEHDYRILRHQFATLQIGSELFRNLALDVVDFHQIGIDMLVGVDYMHWRRFYLSYAAGLLYIQKVRPGADPHAPPVKATAKAGTCQPPEDLVASLSRAPLVVVSRPRMDPPEPAKAARVDGCVGILFRLTPQGEPRDLKVVAEAPPGYGLGAFVAREVAAARFEPSPDQGWHYEVHRVHLSPAP